MKSRIFWIVFYLAFMAWDVFFGFITLSKHEILLAIVQFLLAGYFLWLVSREWNKGTNDGR